MFRKQIAPSPDSQWEIQLGLFIFGRLNHSRVVERKSRGKFYWDWR